MEASDAALNSLHPRLLDLSTISDYGAIAQILRKHSPAILEEKNEETLLLRALCHEIVGEVARAKNCVMIALIIKFTRYMINSVQTIGEIRDRHFL
jgi:hypothetical protein